MSLRISRWLVAVLRVLVMAVAAWYLLTPTAAVARGPGIVEIPAHQGLMGIARHLDGAGVIHDRVTFVALVVARGAARALKAGEYEIPRGAAAPAIVRLLETGRVRQHVILHPEGATITELARVLESERLASADEVVRVAHDPAFLASHRIEGPSAEGYLYPDTYQFVRGMRTDEILGRMVQRLHVKLTPDVLTVAGARHLTLHQLLTLASIIEREAVDRSEMPLISAVFWNRLRRDMPLQADPTVQYALGRHVERVLYRDLAVDSRYNTYRYPGLPPGPVASPGAASLEAAVFPADVPYLYFVAHPDGHHEFRRTFREHAEAIRRVKEAARRSADSTARGRPRAGAPPAVR